MDQFQNNWNEDAEDYQKIIKSKIQSEADVR